MIPTMQPPNTTWNPEAQHIRSNGVGRQTDAINNVGFNIGFNPLTGAPIAGINPTLTPYGTAGFVPTGVPFITPQSIGNYPVGQTIQFAIQTPFGVIPAYATIPSNYGTVPTNYGTIPTNYGTIPTPFGTVPTNYGTIPTAFGTIPTNYGTIPTNYGVCPTGYGMIPSINPFAVNPLQSTINNPFMNIGCTTTNPYNLSVLGACSTGACGPTMQPINTTIPTMMTPFGNVAYPTVGNPFFRPMGGVGTIDACNLAGTVGYPYGIGAITNPYITCTTGGIQTTPSIRTTPFQTMIPTGATIGTTPWNNIAGGSVYGTPWNNIAGGSVYGTPFNTTIPTNFGTPFGGINTPFATLPNPTISNGTTPWWVGGNNAINPFATINPLNVLGTINPLTSAMLPSNGFGGYPNVSGFQPIGTTPFNNGCSTIGTPWNTTSIGGINPITGTPTLFNTAVTNPASLFATAAGYPIC